MPEPLTDTAKSFVLAAAFWLVGSIIFLVAAYKLYQPKNVPQPHLSQNDCGGCCCMQ